MSKRAKPSKPSRPSGRTTPRPRYRVGGWIGETAIFYDQYGPEFTIHQTSPQATREDIDANQRWARRVCQLLNASQKGHK